MTKGSREEDQAQRDNATSVPSSKPKLTPEDGSSHISLITNPTHVCATRSSETTQLLPPVVMKMHEGEMINPASASSSRQRLKRARPEDPTGVSLTGATTGRIYKRERTSSCERKGPGLWDNGVPAESPRHEKRSPTEPFCDNHVERSSVDVKRQNRDDPKHQCDKCQESRSEISDPCDSEEEWILEPPRYSLSFNWRGLDEDLLRIMDESVYALTAGGSCWRGNVVTQKGAETRGDITGKWSTDHRMEEPSASMGGRTNAQEHDKVDNASEVQGSPRNRIHYIRCVHGVNRYFSASLLSDARVWSAIVSSKAK